MQWHPSLGSLALLLVGAVLQVRARHVVPRAVPPYANTTILINASASFTPSNRSSPTSSSSNSVKTITWDYPFSSKVDTNVDVHTNGTGSAYAFACWAATLSYSDSISSMLSNRPSSVYDTFTYTTTYTSQFYDIWTTDCDGMPHVRGTAPTSNSTYLQFSTWYDYTSIPHVSSQTIPSPSCTIGPSDCAYLQSSYSKEDAALSALTSSLTPPFYVTNRPVSPSCTTICTAKPECMIMGDHVRLLYWPVVTTGANSCRVNGTTVITNATEVRTAIFEGHTFTSPWVGLSFQSLQARDWACNTMMGEPVTDTIVSVLPEHLSSARGWHLGRSPYPFNLADLNGFITSAAYCQGQAYDWTNCSMIFDDAYYPTVWMPDEILTMRPEWSQCDRSIFGVNDPPHVLIPANALTEGPPSSIAQPAQPKSTPTGVASATQQSSTPQATATPELEHTQPAGSASQAPAGSQQTNPAGSENQSSAPVEAGYSKGNNGQALTVAMSLQSSTPKAMDSFESIVGKVGDYIASMFGLSATANSPQAAKTTAAAAGSGVSTGQNAQQPPLGSAGGSNMQKPTQVVPAAAGSSYDANFSTSKNVQASTPTTVFISILSNGIAVDTSANRGASGGNSNGGSNGAASTITKIVYTLITTYPAGPTATSGGLVSLLPTPSVSTILVMSTVPVPIQQSVMPFSEFLSRPAGASAASGGPNGGSNGQAVVVEIVYEYVTTYPPGMTITGNDGKASALNSPSVSTVFITKTANGPARSTATPPAGVPAGASTITKIIYTSITTYLAGETLVLNGQTSVLSTPSVFTVSITSTMSAPAQISTSQLHVTAIDGAVYNITPITDVTGFTVLLVDGQTIRMSGSAVTAGAHVFSMASDGVVVDGTSTVDFATVASGTETVFRVVPTTDAAGSTVVVVAGQALHVSGPVVIVGGHAFSVASDGVVVDGSTMIEFAGAKATTTGASGSFTSGSATRSVSASGTSSIITTATNSETVSQPMSTIAGQSSRAGTGRLGIDGLFTGLVMVMSILMVI